MLKNHSPSSPTRPPVEHLYFTVFDPDNNEMRFVTHAFATYYAAYHWLNTITSKHKPNWKTSNIFECQHKGYTLVVRGSHIEDILEAKYTKEELSWTPPYPENIALEHLTNFSVPTRSSVSTITEDSDKPKPQKKPSKPISRHKSTKPSPHGMITVAQMAEQLQIPPNKARQMLRKANIKKPDHGWSYKIDSPEHKAIFKILSA